MNALLQRWPALVGLTSAVLVLIFTADRETTAISVNVAVLCYLSAAAFGRPWLAWAAIPLFSVVVTVAKIAGFAWWAAFAVVGVVLIVAGLAIGVPRKPLWAQVGAAVVYGGLAVVALFLPVVVGGVLAGLALAAHAGWDWVAYRRNEVVPRSLAEACMFLDVPLGVGVVVLSLTA
ncbi:hypothetical protein [Paractinoplanes rishiriensis]|uniref:Uncharacterized protein n=1 Tax=Paractinoplanes rishiriensis TaxID=1050105 RepID=A0A919MPW4_9ACTN|nr:hypothetical protein [Actinoplanes rishiriensis]GIE95511.1 hypothetical protein Ari01nite_29760 [Actinoplanes rishiriensis]